MTLRKISLALALAAVTAMPIAATFQSNSTTITHRIYRALLGRDADPAGLEASVPLIDRGQTRQRVDQIVASTEFRNKVRGWSTTQLLTQIYQGLLLRDPDAGAANWEKMLQQRRFTDVIMGIMAAPEFTNKLGTTTAPAAGATADASAAANCQENVVEAIRNDLTGFVFIQFDNATVNGSTISGAATDVSDGGRRLTYRCDSGTSYTYDDGRRARTAPVSGEFANEIVRSCQGEIRTKVQRTGAADVEFESAGLMPGSDMQWVRGLGFQKSSSGANGANFHYSCDMRGTQILVSSFRNR
jgi:hypothetical protein